MRLFVSSLNSENSGGVVENPFSAVSLVASETGRFMMYTGLEIVGNDRIYICYRNCTGHDPFDGIIYMKYSDDDGETWGGEVIAYDPAHIFEDQPDLLLLDPDIKVDARDPRLLVSPDGTTLILSTFVSIGKNETNGDRTILSEYRNMSIAFPINGKDLDYNNKEIVYIVEDWEAFSGGTVNYNNAIWYTTNVTPSNRSNNIYKSLDNGSTWSLYSTSFKGLQAGGTDDDHAGGESTYSVVGNDIFGIAKAVLQPSETRKDVYGKSVDGGLNWTYDTTSCPYNLVGLGSTTLNDGRIAVCGRGIPALFVFNSNDFAFVSGSDLNWAQSGYSNIMKYKDKYIISWYNVNVIEFRQLNYDPATYKFTFGND